MENDQMDTGPLTVFSGSLWETELLRSLLADEGVEAVTADENTGTLAPWYTAGGGAGSVRLMISSSDLERARPVIDAFLKNTYGTP